MEEKSMNPGIWSDKLSEDFWDRMTIHAPWYELAKMSLVKDIVKNNGGQAIQELVLGGYLSDKVELAKTLASVNCKLLHRKIMSVDGLEDFSGVFTYTLDRGIIYVNIDANNYCSVHAYVADKDIISKISTIQKYLKPRAESREIYVIASRGSGFDLVDIGQAAYPLERENYSTETLEEYDNIVSDLNSDTPSGRISILEGPPGSGKTFMVKGLLHDAPDATCVIVPAGMVAQLAGPNLISVLLNAKDCGGANYPIILIIEDGDMAIIKRDAGNMDTITSLLNFGDGMLGSLIDLRIVITTNASKLDMDDAIKRPGRLSGIIKVDSLPVDQANKILSKLLDGKKFDFSFDRKTTLAEIYKKAKGFGWKPPEKVKNKESNFDDIVNY